MLEYDPKKYICSCAKVTYDDVVQALKSGEVNTLAHLREKTHATGFCGSCTERVQAFLDACKAGEAVPMTAEKEAEKSYDEHPIAIYREVCPDIFWVGGCDRSSDRFEKQYPIPNGMTFNSYILFDQKTVLFDTVDLSVRSIFLRNVEAVLGSRKLDYVVVNHMEPDHCTTLDEIMRRYPKCEVICTAQAKKMIGQFFTPDLLDRVQTIREGVSIMTGRHVLSFHLAPMVHWPEVMVTYDRESKTLFSADAFGGFGSLDGNLFADELDYDRNWMDEARRYYCNIVGKYGPQVQALLKKAAALDIQRICPLHGPVWRKDINTLIDKYQLWSTYTPESKSVVIAYASVYGHTEMACFALASALSKRGVRDVRMYDVSRTHYSNLIGEAFRCSHLVLASVTYNTGLFPDMEHFVLGLKSHGLKNRTVGLMENGTWAPASAGKIEEVLKTCGMNILPQRVRLMSALKQGQQAEIDALADAIVESMNN